MSDQNLLNAHEGDYFSSLTVGYREWVTAKGYTPSTIKTIMQAVSRLTTYMQARDIDPTELTPGSFEALRRDAMERGVLRSQDLYAVSSFQPYLVDIGVAVASDPEPEPQTDRGKLRAAYADYLRSERGLQPSTVTACLQISESFMTFHFGEGTGDLATIDAENLAAFMLTKRSRDGQRVQRDVPSHLRTFLRFLFCTGRIERDIARALPRLGAAKPGRIPRYLPPEDVAKLLDFVRDHDPLARRNYAMLQLMARLGLRAPEVVKIRLEDVDWRGGELLIHGKGGYLDRMPLPQDVGAAIVDYLRHDRKGDSRFLFVSSRAPFKPFTDGQILRYILEKAYERTGVQPPQAWIGSSILRHSLATDLLRKGASLEEVGDVLRHRSPMTTTIYARHDLDALRSVARAWPLEGAAQ